MSPAPLRLHSLGEAALLCELPAPATLAQQQRIWTLAAEAMQWRGVQEVLPGMNNLSLLFDPAQIDVVELEMQVLSAWPQLAAAGIQGRQIEIPVAYGGAFYALADCHQFGLEFGSSRVRDFVDAATALTERLKAEFPLSHPDHADLAFLYGTILTDGHDAFSGEATKNVCVFADAEVDRSPTGSGVTARLAAMHAKGEIEIGQTRTFESIAGSRFSGAVVRTAKTGPHDAIIARVGGRAYYSGRTEFIVEPDDELGRGFLLR